MEGQGRRRRRHSAQFKQSVLADCAQPGASIAAVALAHGLNANLPHRWRRQAGDRRVTALPARAPVTSSELHFVPVRVPEALASTDIRIEVRQGATALSVHWPLSAARECAGWLAQWLR